MCFFSIINISLIFKKVGENITQSTEILVEKLNMWASRPVWGFVHLTILVNILLIALGKGVNPAGWGLRPPDFGVGVSCKRERVAGSPKVYFKLDLQLNETG